MRMARITSPGARPTRAVACRSTAICSCGSPVSASARRSVKPVDAAHDAFGLLGQLRQLVEVGPEDADRDVGRRAAQPLVDAHAERRREQHGDAGQVLEPLPHVVLDRGEIPRAVALQRHQHVGHRVRHRILGALGPAGPPDDVVDLRHLSEHVLDAMVQAIDLLERRLGRQDRLQQERALRRAAA